MTSPRFREILAGDTALSLRSGRNEDASEIMRSALFLPFRLGIMEALRELERLRDRHTRVFDSKRQRFDRMAVCAAAVRLCETGRIRPPKWCVEEFTPNSEEFAELTKFGGTRHED